MFGLSIALKKTLLYILHIRHLVVGIELAAINLWIELRIANTFVLFYARIGYGIRIHVLGIQENALRIGNPNPCFNTHHMTILR